MPCKSKSRGLQTEVGERKKRFQDREGREKEGSQSLKGQEVYRENRKIK